MQINLQMGENCVVVKARLEMQPALDSAYTKGTPNTMNVPAPAVCKSCRSLRGAEWRKCGRRWLEEQAVQSQGEDRGPTACRGWECALGTGVTCWEPAEKFPEFAVMEIVYTRSMGEEEGVSQIYRSVRDGKKCLGKQKG